MCKGSEFHIGIYADGEQAALDAALAAIEEDSDRAYVGEFFGYRLQ